MIKQLFNASIDCVLMWNLTFQETQTSLIREALKKNNEQHHSFVQHPDNFYANNSNEDEVNIELMQYPTFDLRALVFVIIYSCVFVVAAIGNVTVFVNLFRFRRRTHISTMIIHLTLADLIVTFIMLPIEIAWRLTVQWIGGNLACKVLQFFRAFGLYLSSNILICISCDRYFAVVHPLMVVNKRRRGRLMLYCAWLASILYALPQMFIFHVETHPRFSNFTQCVTFGSFTSESHEFFYNLACLIAMYFVPLLVIIATYTSILWVMWRKSHVGTPDDSSSSKIQIRSDEIKLRKYKPYNHNKGVSWNISSTTSTNISKHRDNLILRHTGKKCIERARVRTLKMTIFIIIIFLICWTPYVFMALWYIIDRTSATKVPNWMQDALFMMAVSNSSVNPILYGRFTLRTLIGHNKGSKYQTYLFCCFSCSGQQHNIPAEEVKNSARGSK